MVKSDARSDGNPMRRRDFIMRLGGAVAAWPFGARAQQRPTPVIGFLNSSSPDVDGDRIRAYRQGLSEAGYVEGRNVAIEYRWADGHNDRLPALAIDLVNRGVNVIVTGGTPATLAAKAATATIPIVFILSTDPVEAGLVASLNRPGGNITGITGLNVELAPKKLELMHELLPAANIMALLTNPTNPIAAERQSQDVQAAARKIGLQLHVLNASTTADFDPVFTRLAQLRVGALVIGSDLFFSSHSEQLAELTVRHRLPSIYQFREFAVAGGLIGLRGKRYRLGSSGRHPYGQDSCGCQAVRPSGRAIHQGRADHQPKDREGARPHLSNHAAWTR
jgi:putative tryptophan/tyrosine transport system substrate-binding protein